MKAEQRKELETNTLADKMGQVMQRVQTSPRRTFLTYVLVTGAVLVAAWLGYRWYSSERVDRSLQWLKLYDGASNHIDELRQEGETNAGKAARFQAAWFSYWDFGIKMMGVDKDGALKRLKQASEEYGKLAEDCKDDKVFEPQALLGRAVAKESLAVQDRDHLKKAKEYYEELVAKYEKSAEAGFAKKRLEILQDDARRQELSATYKELQGLLQIPAPLQPQQPGIKGPGDIFDFKGKKQP